VNYGVKNRHADHKEGEQLEDRKNVGESSCNFGDGTDQRVQSLIFTKMMRIDMHIGLSDISRTVAKISQHNIRRHLRINSSQLLLILTDRAP